MSPVVEDRKADERELHDHLRGDLASDPYYTSNKKFYAIGGSNKDFVKKWLAERCAGKKALDYCCGNGQHTFWLAEAGAEAYGIDISPVSVEVAAERACSRGLGNVMSFAVMDGEAMEFDDSSFDIVLVSGVLHHLDLRKAYGELARILKPDGEIICTEALRHNPLIHAYRKMTPHLRSAWEADHILGKEEIGMARQHFERVEVLRFFHLATLAAIPFRNRAVFERLRRSLEMVDSVLLKTPILQWQAWMAVFALSRPRNSVWE